MRTDEEKTEALVKTFVRVYSGNNLPPEAKVAREELIRDHPRVLEKKLESDEAFNVICSMF